MGYELRAVDFYSPGNKYFISESGQKHHHVQYQKNGNSNYSLFHIIFSLFFLWLQYLWNITAFLYHNLKIY